MHHIPLKNPTKQTIRRRYLLIISIRSAIVFLSVFQRPEPAGAEHDDRPGIHHSTEPRFWHWQPVPAPRVEPAFRQCQWRHQWGWFHRFIKSSFRKCDTLLCSWVGLEKQREHFVHLGFPVDQIYKNDQKHTRLFLNHFKNEKPKSHFYLPFINSLCSLGNYAQDKAYIHCPVPPGG